MHEYRERQHEFPDEIGNTLGAFLGGLQKAHHDNLIGEIEFLKAVQGLKNIETKLQTGDLNAEQALTLMQSLPALEYCDAEGFGLDTARVKMNMRVSSHASEKKTTEGSADTSGSIKIGGIAAAFGAGGSMKVSGHIAHSAEQANEADYSAYTEIEVTLKRTKPAPARRLTSEFMQEFIKDTHAVIKGQVARQKDALRDELAGKEPPKSLPEEQEDANDVSDDADGSDTPADDSGLGN